ncbi:MAG: MarR family transcriptional regulator [Candidatus Bathyarchaeota archaeon]|nr:MarR family transcriptional regulator [Candidatus Bathyarchaeum tardum]
MSNLKNLDLATKIILIILVIVLSFIVLFLVSSEFLVDQSTFGRGMMDHMGNNTDYTVPILLSLAIALVAGVLITFWLKPTMKTQPIESVQSSSRIDELEIIKRALSDDEKQVLDEIRRAGEITQDSLRFRLGWSKAKLSRILTNLDKLNLIQRERFGKTYKVFLTENHSNQ